MNSERELFIEWNTGDRKRIGVRVAVLLRRPGGLPRGRAKPLALSEIETIVRTETEITVR